MALSKQERAAMLDEYTRKYGTEYRVSVSPDGRVGFACLFDQELPSERRTRLVDEWTVNQDGNQVNYGVTEVGPATWDVTGKDDNYTVQVVNGYEVGGPQIIVCTCPYAEHNGGDCNHIARVQKSLIGKRGESVVNNILQARDAIELDRRAAVRNARYARSLRLQDQETELS